MTIIKGTPMYQSVQPDPLAAALVSAAARADVSEDEEDAVLRDYAAKLQEKEIGK
jgi:hypothetical protein